MDNADMTDMADIVAMVGAGQMLARAGEIEEIEEIEETESSPAPEAEEIEEITSISKYAAKKLKRQEIVQNSKKIRQNSAVSTRAGKLHNKVSKAVLLAYRNTKTTVVCEVTGTVCVLNIPIIPGKVLAWASPLASLSNCRGIAQQGRAYLHSLETQILAGIFIVLASEYELIKTRPSATGAENNAILRTASKEKLIQGILLIESYIHSSNCSFVPRLSLIYDSVLRDAGIEARLTEWMRLVNEALAEPDKEFYDENQLLNKSMRGIRELKKEYTAAKNIEKRLSFLKDPLCKERAQFRKEMKEAKEIVRNLGTSLKLSTFLNTLFSNDVFLTIDMAMISQIIVKIEAIATHSAKRLVEILNVDRRKLRAEASLDDLDDLNDPLMPSIKEEIKEEEIEERKEEEIERKEEEKECNIMPSGLSFTERLLWKKKQGM